MPLKLSTGSLMDVLLTESTWNSVPAGFSDLGRTSAFGTGQGVSENVGIAGADDAPAGRPSAEQVKLAHLLAPDAIDPCQHIGSLQHLDRLIDGIAAAFGLLGYRLVAGEAKPGLAVVEAKQHGLEHLHNGAGDRAAMLALLPVLGVVAEHESFEPCLGVAVERNASGRAEYLLPPWA
jgi:hypothetical protein